jgi:hypothetical protein
MHIYVNYLEPGQEGADRPPDYSRRRSRKYPNTATTAPTASIHGSTPASQAMTIISAPITTSIGVE